MTSMFVNRMATHRLALAGAIAPGLAVSGTAAYACGYGGGCGYPRYGRDGNYSCYGGGSDCGFVGSYYGGYYRGGYGYRADYGRDAYRHDYYRDGGYRRDGYRDGY